MGWDPLRGAYLGGIKDELKTQLEIETSKPVDQQLNGYAETLQMFIGDKELRGAILDGANEYGAPAGMDRADRVAGFFQKLDDVAMQNGGSYQPMIAAYQNNPDELIDNLRQGNVGYIEGLYNSKAPDLNGALALSSDSDNPVAGKLLEGQEIVDAKTGGSYVVDRNSFAVSPEVVHEKSYSMAMSSP